MERSTYKIESQIKALEQNLQLGKGNKWAIENKIKNLRKELAKVIEDSRIADWIVQ